MKMRVQQIVSFYLIILTIFGSTYSYAFSPTLSEQQHCDLKWGEYLQQYQLAPELNPLVGLCNDNFRSKLQQLIATNIDLGYYRARLIMFSSLDNHDGQVCSVYIGECVQTEVIPARNMMNCEHTWPQSRGATGIAKSDLHHLFPVIPHVNSRRSNHPFCEVVEIRTAEQGSFYGLNREGIRCFEPRAEHKGDVARAMFYFAVRYNQEIGDIEESYLREWYKIDRVSLKELERNRAIERVQYNRNPFIDAPELITFIDNF